MSGLVTLVSIIFLGFFLGMRHATDADHVIAVSTIVSREHTLRSAILIGSAWGVGHTLTIVGVGGALILFSVVIPPRLGLSMEMAVGLMLIVLGMWNLTGILKWLQEVFSSGRMRPPDLHTHVHSHGDYGHSRPLCLRRATARRAHPVPASGLWAAESRVRPRPRLPDRFRERAVHGSAPLGPEVRGRAQCTPNAY